ncbi:nickel ABC transporter substrate-binding protein [Clostridiaceae bacterium M8S5]|nr:nickel ABC transporter substrate-binding protein [Clostridiaceae bacterium M8S5]
MARKLCVICITMLMAMILIVGCSDDAQVSNNDKDSSNTEQSNEKQNNDVKKVKEITLCENFGFSEGFYTVFTPGNNMNHGVSYYLDNFYETLVEYENGKIIPALAKSWTISEDGTVYTFKLVEGVKFSDGTDFNAKVVKKNLEMIPKLLGDYNGSFGLVTTLFEELKIVDNYTIQIKLKTPYYGALQDFAKPMPMSMMSLDAFNEDGTLSDKLLSHTLGTGPYMFEKQQNGNLYTFVRNPLYHGQKPDINKFNIKVIPDNESKILALRKGEIDMIFGCSKLSYDSIKEFSQNDKFTTKVSKESLKTRIIGFNLDKEPFNDKNLRVAISHAIDKQSICNNLFYGYETVAHSFFNKSLPYCNVDTEPYNYDLEEAKNILEKAGWVDTDGDGIREKNSKPLVAEILYKTGEGSSDEISLTISSYFKQLGIDVKVTGLDLLAWYSKVQEGNYTVVYRETYGIPFDPFTGISNMNSDIMVDHSYAQGLAHLNDGNEIISQLSTSVNEEDIQKKYNYILKEIHANNAYVPISEMKELTVYSKEKIANYKFDGQPSNFNIANITLK